MSLRLQLLQDARLAPRLLGDSTDLVREFFRQQLSPAGAGRDRDGRPDLYYTIFALAGLQALDVEVPREKVEAFLRSHGEGEKLDFVHVSALAFSEHTRTSSDTALLASVPYTVAIYWRQAEKYLKRAEGMMDG